MILLRNSTPHSWIAESLDVVKQIGLGFVTGAVPAVMYPILLEQAQETFTGCVVTAMTDFAHATQERIAVQETLVVIAGELAAATRMQND